VLSLISVGSTALHSLPFSLQLMNQAPQKTKPPIPNNQNIVLKPANKVRFVSQIRTQKKHKNIINLCQIFYA